MELMCTNDGWSWDDTSEVNECAFCCDGFEGMKESHGICGSVEPPRKSEVSRIELRSGEKSGREPSPLCKWAFAAAAAALCWKSVINMAAVSRSSIPSLLASICSNVP